MSKNDIIAVASTKCPELTKATLKAAFDAITATISESLAAGNDVAISGFGTFSVKDVAARTGRNPQTGAEITIAACKKVAFRPATALKEAVNH